MRPLGVFDGLKFLFLRLPHILQLPQHLLGPQVLELQLRTHRLSQVHLPQALLAVVVQQPNKVIKLSRGLLQEVNDLGVGKEMHAGPGQQAPIFIPFVEAGLSRRKFGVVVDLALASP